MKKNITQLESPEAQEYFHPGLPGQPPPLQDHLPPPHSAPPGKKNIKAAIFLGVFICAQDPVKSKELKQMPKLLTGSRSVPLLPLSG